MKKLKIYLSLFLSMFKIGLFTFGGGYAMIAIIERELIEKKKWLNHDEFLDVIAIAESTPGPIAINSATFIGYKRGGVLGALFSTLGVVMPSFIIIYIISLFFDKFVELEYVKYAFRGIQVAVAFIILSAGFKMLKGIKKTAFNIILFSITIVLLVLFTLLGIAFSSIYFIIAGAVIGLIFYFVSMAFKNKGDKKC